MNPADSRADADPVVEAYKAGLDRSLIRENLRRSIEEQLEGLAALQEFADELRRSGRRAHDAELEALGEERSQEDPPS